MHSHRSWIIQLLPYPVARFELAKKKREERKNEKRRIGGKEDDPPYTSYPSSSKRFPAWKKFSTFSQRSAIFLSTKSCLVVKQTRKKPTTTAKNSHRIRARGLVNEFAAPTGSKCGPCLGLQVLREPTNRLENDPLSNATKSGDTGAENLVKRKFSLHIAFAS